MRSTTMVKNYEKKMRNLQYNCSRTLIIEIRIAVKFISFCQENFA